MLALVWVVASLAHPALHAAPHSDADDACCFCLTLHSAQPVPVAPQQCEPLVCGESVAMPAPPLAAEAPPLFISSRAPPAASR